MWGAIRMKPRKGPPGNKNIIGEKVVAIRRAKHIKQKDFLIKLQTLGMDISATSLSRLEGQYRLVQDYEVVTIAEALEIPVQELLGKRHW
jgi:transcriptional regulator with XRE-family HTH domain